MALFDNLFGENPEKRAEAFGLVSFLKEMKEEEQGKEEEQDENAFRQEDFEKDAIKDEKKEGHP